MIAQPPRSGRPTPRRKTLCSVYRNHCHTRRPSHSIFRRPTFSSHTKSSSVCEKSPAPKNSPPPAKNRRKFRGQAHANPSKKDFFSFPLGLRVSPPPANQKTQKPQPFPASQRPQKKLFRYEWSVACQNPKRRQRPKNRSERVPSNAPAPNGASIRPRAGTSAASSAFFAGDRTPRPQPTAAGTSPAGTWKPACVSDTKRRGCNRCERIAEKPPVVCACSTDRCSGPPGEFSQNSRGRPATPFDHPEPHRACLQSSPKNAGPTPRSRFFVAPVGKKAK